MNFSIAWHKSSTKIKDFGIRSPSGSRDDRSNYYKSLKVACLS